ncbi:F-box protein At4g22280-like [Chenopodium quinoa]|uniref:F-box protein At4g22280-like n=1 Tax=Chenopodium quinoa TaxID=63459 RepID=UPI000B78502C|nr:F-box protein At4g22280-like [Chenopodium quinoa]
MAVTVWPQAKASEGSICLNSELADEQWLAYILFQCPEVSDDIVLYTNWPCCLFFCRCRKQRKRDEDNAVKDRINTCCYPELEPKHVNEWITYPSTRGVKELDIHIRVREPADKLPSAIFNCRTLEVLKLDVNLDLEVPSSLCLPNLKELHISVVCFPVDDSLTRLVSSCPSLEYMTLCGSLSPETPISISSNSLRILKLNTFFCSSILGCKLVLDVPNLEYFMVCV